jgi:hypothetical protein
MQVNMAVEPLVREALGAAVGRDIDRSIAAMKAMADRGDAAVQDSLNLAGAVTTYALFDLHEGERPDDDQLSELAKSFVEMESWARFDEQTSLAFLMAIADHAPAQTLAPETVTRITFVMCAWLLAAFGPDERDWYTYLDQILDVIETDTER